MRSRTKTAPLFKLPLLALLLLTGLLSTLPTSSRAGDGVDSLVQVLEKEISDDERMETLIRIGRELYSKEPDSALSYLDRAEGIAERIMNRSGTIEISNLKGLAYYTKGEYPKVLPQWKKVLEMKEEEGEILEVSHIRNNLGQLYQKMGGYADALEEHQKAYRIRDSLGEEEAISESANNLGNVHYVREDYEKAEFYYRKALENLKGNGEDAQTAIYQNNLGLIHQEKGEHEKALDFFKKAYRISQEQGDLTKSAQRSLNIGTSFREMEEFDSAEHYLEGALDHFRTLGNEPVIARVFLAQAELLERQERLSEAIEKGQRAFVKADSATSLPVMVETTEMLSELYSKMGMHRKAFEKLKMNQELKATLTSKEEEERMDKMEARFNARQKEKELEKLRMEQEKVQLERERLMLLAFGGGAVFLLLSIFLYFGYRQKKKRNELLAEQNRQVRKQKEEKELLLQELHHRVKNNLQLIISLLNLQTDRINDPEALEIHRNSQNRVRSMGLLHERMHRLSELDRNQFEHFVKELSERLIETYGMEEALELETDIDADGLGTNTLTPVALILNELLSNALKYGFGEGQSGWVGVTVKPQENGHYMLEVQDNGAGFGDLGNGDGDHAYGLDIVRSLTEQLEGELVKKEQEQGSCIQVFFKNVG